MKKTLKVIFLIIFIDLIGFSIIFPLFPAMIEYYTANDPDNFFLKLVLDYASQFGSEYQIVIFGGILGSIYSILQFISTPIWGAISDRVGRRPVLLISLSGLFISYLLWIFAGSFTLLLVARFIGGIMAGNISTATAAVADITTAENRSKGMAIVGIAFALGFILGPFIGGISTLFDFKAIEAFSFLTPFSIAAAIASLATLINIFMVLRSFPETLPKEKRGIVSTERTANPIKLLKPLPFPGINMTNWGYFLFLIVFSGMEFTLTFLAADRLNYTPMDNGWLFVFIGFFIALTQGGVVRRYAYKVGEKKMSAMGLVFVIPSFFILAQAHSSIILYLALALMAIGSAMIIPCLTALVSLYTPAEEQGKSIGIFRSLGALARAIGPLAASLFYWAYGPATSYQLGAFCLLLPLLLILALPAHKKPTSSSE